MIKVETKMNIKVPNFNFQDDLLVIADTIIIPQLQKNIHAGVQVDGTPFPALESATIKRKAGTILERTFDKKGNIRKQALKAVGKGGLRGFSVRTLIETGQLISSFFSKKAGKSSVVISLKPIRKEIGGYLQIEGVGKRKKKFQFFGISTFMEQDAVRYLKEKINGAIRSAKRS